jgi:hypothetical protein
MKKPIDQLELTEAGAFLVTPKGNKKQIAAPIRFKAIGYRVAHDKQIAIAEITFVDRNGKMASEYFDMSETLPRNRYKIIETLADAGYRWPTERTLPERLIDHVLASEPNQSFTMVGAPGWYGDIMLTSRRQYGKGNRFVLDPNAGAHVARLTLGPGSLVDWQRTVAKIAKQSSRLRLMIGAAFAAPLLRPLGMESFALNLFGTTSTGKTSGGLYAAGSVAGLFGENGLPGWADSIPALEQLAVGHRDGVLPLDDTGDEGGGPLPIHKKAKCLAFMFGRNRGRNLDKSYEKKSKLTTKEFRVIALSTSEIALKVIAESAADPRLGGEEARFTDVPAMEPDSVGIFDHLHLSAGDNPTKVGQRLVNELRREAIKNQGFAMDAFQKRVARDPAAAVEKAKAYMAQFEKNVASTLTTGADHRIAANFAAIYAGTALAIEYDILPWGKKATRAAIAKCMAAAFATIRNPSSPLSSTIAAPTIRTVATALKDHLDRLTLMKVEKGKPCSDEEAIRRQKANGFRVGQKLLIKPQSWRCTDSDVRLLIEHRILETQRSDVATIDRKIMGVPGKRRYYVIDGDKLAAVIAAAVDQEAS